MGNFMSEKDSRRKALGRQGEDLASAYLQSQGMTIIKRNHHSGRKELDVICAQPVQGGVNIRFVEVKTRQEPVEGQAWEAVNRRKQANMANAARGYLISDEFRALGLRCQEIFFDIVTVVWDSGGTSYQLEYIPDAFRMIYV